MNGRREVLYMGDFLNDSGRMKNLILIITAVLAFAISSCLKLNSQYGTGAGKTEKSRL